MSTPALAFATVFIACFSVPAVADDAFVAWTISSGRVRTIGGTSAGPLPVGSLQKPFLVRAWARSHPAGATPRFNCTNTSGCWRPGGHGALDLRGAIRESCNTYFKLLAHDTPQDARLSSFREAGFTRSGEIGDAESIGLPGPAGMKVAPESLLRAYVDLVRAPWSQRDDVREEVLAGLRDSANDGTASGLRLWGFFAKTGTVPALDGAPLKTSGFAIVLDELGFAFLGMLRHGTGREAAIRSGTEIAKLRPGSMTRPAAARQVPPRMRTTAAKRDLDGPVRVVMLNELRLRDFRLRNEGGGPVDSSRGFVGPNAVVDSLKDGEHFGAGEWRIESTKRLFERRVRASLEARDDGEFTRLIATMKARDYVNGVLKAELGSPTGFLRTQLASAVLRYVARGPRHGEADVCDSTHCAWFVGEGPVPRWVRPDTAVNDATMASDLEDTEWSEALAAARRETRGTEFWTADCGGDPVSPHFIWGNGDTRVMGCPRHPKGHGAVWRRTWTNADMASVFGAAPESIEVAVVNGQWMLKIRLRSNDGAPSKVLGLTYDDAHRRLASHLGWDALPAPASRVSRSANGFVAEGVGFGHRVGLCLRK